MEVESVWKQGGFCESCSFLKESQIAARFVVKGYPDDCRIEINEQFSQTDPASAAASDDATPGLKTVEVRDISNIFPTAPSRYLRIKVTH